MDGVKKNIEDARRFPLGEADLAARELVDLLQPHCDRIEVAGSVLRRRFAVKDIEIVAIQKVRTVAERDLFGVAGTAEETPLLWEFLDGLAAKGDIAYEKRGPIYRQ